MTSDSHTPAEATGRELGDQLSVSRGDLAASGTRVAAAAEADDLLDVAYRTVDSPIGELLITSTRRGLVRVAFEWDEFGSVLDALASRLGPRVLRAPGRLDTAAREFGEYFDGTRTLFDVPLDHALSSGFRQRVQRYLPRIPYAQTLTYKQVAEAVGNPKAVRAVGTACATNPLPVVVPCHRILRGDGGVGGYLGGVEAKKILLALEADVARMK